MYYVYSGSLSDGHFVFCSIPADNFVSIQHFENKFRNGIFLIKNELSRSRIWTLRCFRKNDGKMRVTFYCLRILKTVKLLVTHRKSITILARIRFSLSVTSFRIGPKLVGLTKETLSLSFQFIIAKSPYLYFFCLYVCFTLDARLIGHNSISNP